MVLAVSLVVLASFGVGFATATLGRRTTTATPVPTHARSVRPAVSLAPRTSVPDLTGLRLVSAVRVLRSMGLRVGRLTARTNPWERGVILSQGWKPGSDVGSGAMVTLVLSAGPDPSPFEINGLLQVDVGGTCELVWPQPSSGCMGGPLIVPFEEGA
jgi:hypothetical protein